MERDKKIVKRTFELDFDNTDTSINDVILKLQETKNTYGASTKIEFQGDSPERNCLIFIYERVETDAEFDSRRRNECEAERRRLVAEEKEKELYLKLKEKYDR